MFHYNVQCEWPQHLLGKRDIMISWIYIIVCNISYILSMDSSFGSLSICTCCMPRLVYCNLSTGLCVRVERRGISLGLEFPVVSESRSSCSSCWLPDGSVLWTVSWTWLSFNWRISICSSVSWVSSWLCLNCTPSWQWVCVPWNFCFFCNSFLFSIIGKKLHGSSRSRCSVLSFRWFPSGYTLYTGRSGSNWSCTIYTSLVHRSAIFFFPRILTFLTNTLSPLFRKLSVTFASYLALLLSLLRTGKNLNNTYQQYDILHETHTSTIRTNTTSRMFY